MPRCPAGHRSGTDDWCDDCGRPLTDPDVCTVCEAPLGGRFCDECGADTALPAAVARIGTDPGPFDGDRGDGLRAPRATSRRVRLDHRRTVLGRRRPGRPAPDVDLVDDEGVSTRHAVLHADDDGGWTVTDLGSRNGTTVGTDGPIPPHRAVPVPPGAVIRLGLWTSVRIEPGAR